MKKIIQLCCWLSFHLVVKAQNVGIGNTNPVERLDVSGAIRIGGTSNAAPQKGTIRWSEVKHDFEGFNGSAWVSLTGGKGRWGSQESLTPETGASVTTLFNSSDGSNGKGQNFGNALANNGQWMAVGAAYEYNGFGTIPRFGSVRLFHKTNKGWMQSSMLIPGDQSNATRFGAAVDFDGNLLAVGAPEARTNGVNNGRVYLYEIAANGTASLQTFLSVSGSNDDFGSSVDLRGDVLIAGAPNYNLNGQLARGIAYVFRRVNNVWSQQGILQPPGGASEDLFGSRVAIWGNRAVVSSIHAYSNGMPRGGKVYTYQYQNNAWTYTDSLTLPGNTYMDKFGMSLQLKDDTLFVGAPQWNGIIEGKSGKVLMYVRNGNSWGLQATITPAGSRTGDGFGFDLHYEGGVLLAGAPYADVHGIPDAGKIYVFRLQGGEWMEEAVMSPHHAEENSHFGMVVNIHPQAAAGTAMNATYNNVPSHGRVYFFDRR